MSRAFVDIDVYADQRVPAMKEAEYGNSRALVYLCVDHVRPLYIYFTSISSPRERERERSFSEQLFRSEASPASVMASSNLRLIATQGGSNNTRAEIPGTILLSLFTGRNPLFAAAATRARARLLVADVA